MEEVLEAVTDIEAAVGLAVTVEEEDLEVEDKEILGTEEIVEDRVV